MNLSSIAKVLGLHAEQSCECHNIVIDSRKVSQGDVFLALIGENLDGHDYVAQAITNGACAVIASKELNLSVPVLMVEDTLLALGKIAAHYRRQFSCPTIALTGSNGKTTVKEMIASILPKPSFATQGNLNNHIGVPLSILQLNDEHRYAVFECGANHIGEIEYTASMAKPKVALINNIAPAHVGEFGSIDNVAKAKGEIYASLDPSGTAVINDDDDYAHFWDDIVVDKKIIRFSLNHPADVWASEIELNQQGAAHFVLHYQQQQMPIQLQLPGKHMVANALAASCCCIAVGIELQQIQQGLQQFSGVAGRMCYKSGQNDSIIIDDTYNANLNSALAALNVLSHRHGDKIMVFGDMGELGSYAEDHHRQVGEAAKKLGIDQFFTCGKLSNFASRGFGASARHFETQDELVAALKPLLNANTSILVKGSRAAQMEKIVERLEEGK